jgi:hypothetical protein
MIRCYQQASFSFTLNKNMHTKINYAAALKSSDNEIPVSIEKTGISLSTA